MNLITTVLADGSVGYYYYNPYLNLLSVLPFLIIISAVWNYAAIRFIHHDKRNFHVDLDAWMDIFIYTIIVFLLEILFFSLLSNPIEILYEYPLSVAYMSSIVSFFIIFLTYYMHVEKDIKNSFLMGILTNPIWLFLFLTMVL